MDKMNKNEYTSKAKVREEIKDYIVQEIN